MPGLYRVASIEVLHKKTACCANYWHGRL